MGIPLPEQTPDARPLGAPVRLFSGPAPRARQGGAGDSVAKSRRGRQRASGEEWRAAIAGQQSAGRPQRMSPVAAAPEAVTGRSLQEDRPVQTALLLIAHGSRQAEANDDLHHVAAELRQRGHAIVVASFLELAAPSI